MKSQVRSAASELILNTGGGHDRESRKSTGESLLTSTTGKIDGFPL